MYVRRLYEHQFDKLKKYEKKKNLEFRALRH